MFKVPVFLAFAALIPVLYAFNYQIEVHTGSGSWPAHWASTNVILSDGRNVHNISMNWPSLQQRWAYRSLAAVPFAAPAVRAASVQYIPKGPFDTMTMDKVVVIPVYLSEPYRSQLTQRFCLYNKQFRKNELSAGSKC